MTRVGRSADARDLVQSYEAALADLKGDFALQITSELIPVIKQRVKYHLLNRALLLLRPTPDVLRTVREFLS
jgi:hypothetical protein